MAEELPEMWLLAVAPCGRQLGPPEEEHPMPLGVASHLEALGLWSAAEELEPAPPGLGPSQALGLSAAEELEPAPPGLGPWQALGLSAAEELGPAPPGLGPSHLALGFGPA
jgi:hypothetical protein